MKKQILSLLSFWALSTLSSPLIAEERINEKVSADAGKQDIQLISAPESNRVPVDELRLFTEIFEQLKNHYVDPVSDQTLIQNAINGMLALDPHSKYYAKEEYERIKNQTSGSVAGIGIETRYDEKGQRFLITKVLANSPAQEAQLKQNDQILKIDNKPVNTVSAKDRSKLLQGAVSTSVTLTILRDDAPFEVTLKRQNIEMPSLSTAKLYNHEFAYFKLDRFQENTNEEIVNALMALEVEAKTENAKIRGVILDLRDNLGGLLTASIAVADLFLDEGLITYTAGQSERFRDRYEAQKGDIIANIPLIVLINAQSASGSEIVAGALQDHARALIVGENSYGKGSIQMVQPLKNGDAIRYTSARYYTPKGRSIQNEGITPDVILPTIEAKIITSKKAREIDNLGHLENQHSSNSPSSTTAKSSQEDPTRMPANFAYLIEQGDFPLYEALNILRAMSSSTSSEGDSRLPEQDSSR